MKNPTELPLVALLGPTASGKSSLAVWLAERQPRHGPEAYGAGGGSLVAEAPEGVFLP